MNKIDREIIQSAMTYAEYRQLVSSLLEKNRTTGKDQSPAMLHYTTMNEVRMERLDKTIKLTPEITEKMMTIRQSQLWLVLTEAWCGDAAQSIPVMAKMASLNPWLDLRLILRDEHPQVMDAFLTNGGRSIPKLIILAAGSLEVLGSWGPRPAAAQQMIMEGKAALEKIPDEQLRKKAYQQLSTNLQKWYVRDKTRSVQEEILDVILKAQKIRLRA